MKFMYLLYGDESADETMTPDELGAMLAEFERYDAELTAAGLLVAGEGLQPTVTATTMTVRGGDRVLTDGPFAETREQLGGFYVVDVPDLDTALDWAARIPTVVAGGSVEVRPVIDYEAMEAGEG